MNDDPLIRPADTSGDLPGSAAPVVRRESADPDLPKTAREVATAIGTLITEVKQLNRGQVVLKRIIAGLVIVALAAGFTLWQQWETDKELRATQERAICPVYNMLLSSANPTSRERWPRGPADYDANLAALRDIINDELKCS